MISTAGNSGRFAELRRLAVPTLALFVVGCLAGWWGRFALARWLFQYTDNGYVAGPSSPTGVAQALVQLAATVGFVFALPLLTWQAWSLLAPLSLSRARHRFGAYLAASFAVMLASLYFLVCILIPADIASSERLRQIDPLFFIRTPSDVYLVLLSRVICFISLAAALMVTTFFFARYRAATRWYTTVALTLGLGTFVMVQIWLLMRIFHLAAGMFVLYVGSAGLALLLRRRSRAH